MDSFFRDCVQDYVHQSQQFYYRQYGDVIAQFFALYNADKQSVNQGFSIQQSYYETYIHNHARASDCIGCGKCEKICPQHLPIRQYLKDVAKAFEG